MAATQTTGKTAQAGQTRINAMTVLGEVFSSKVRATLLAWVVPRLETRFSLTELSHEVGAPISSLQHECYKLERLGVLKGRREGASRRYQVQVGHHLTRPLVNLVIATLGLETVLQEALADAGSFDTAVISGADAASGQMVLALIGETDLEGLDRVQHRVSLIFGVEQDRIELAYFQREDWLEYGESGHPMVQRLAGRQVHLIAGEWPPAG